MIFVTTHDGSSARQCVSPDSRCDTKPGHPTQARVAPSIFSSGLRRGVSRASARARDQRRIDEGLLAEVFSNEGIGTPFTSRVPTIGARSEGHPHHSDADQESVRAKSWSSAPERRSKAVERLFIFEIDRTPSGAWLAHYPYQRKATGLPLRQGISRESWACAAS